VPEDGAGEKIRRRQLVERPSGSGWLLNGHDHDVCHVRGKCVQVVRIAG
jgi:hypothetical protein